MNFWMLHAMIENLLKSYTCPNCWAKDITEKNIDIVGAAGNTVNIDMLCPSCNKHFIAKTEVLHMEIGNIHADKLQEIQQSLSALKGKLWGNIEIEIETPKEKISDDAITSLQKDLKSTQYTADDLFSEE